jgi:AraC-like DNA-binding protein
LLDAFLHINIAQTLFAAIIIVVTKRPLNITDKLLSAWLFFVMCSFVMKLININFQDHFEFDLIGRGAIITLSFPSFLYLYVKYLISGVSKFKSIDLFHFLPFVFISFYVLFLSYYNPNFSNLLYSNGNVGLLLIMFGVVSIAIFTLYGYYTIHLLNKYRKTVDDLYSFHNTNVSLKWVWTLVLIFYSYYFLAIIINGLNKAFEIDFRMSNILIPVYTFFIYTISFRGYVQPKLLAQKEETEDNKPTESYQKSGLKKSDADKYAKMLTKLMQEEKLWLNPEVNLNEISRHIGIPQHYITQVLNEQLNKNLYTFVNEFRANEVIHLFKEEKYKNWSIIAIAFEAGFNSKSSFNTFFKKFTGKTPSEYRKELAPGESS